MESSFASRVKQFRTDKQLSQTAFGERCGLTQGNIAHMEGGKEPLQTNVSKLVAGFPDLNPDWLLLGTGPMLRDGRTLVPASTQSNESPEPVSVAKMPPSLPREVAIPGDSPFTRVSRGGDQVDPLVDQLLQRIAEQAKTIERLWGQNDLLLERKKTDASADAADVYDLVGQIQAEYAPFQTAALPAIQRFVPRPVVRRMDIGFGRQA